MRGNDNMMNKLYGTVNVMLASKNKSNTVDTNRQVVFSFFHDDKVTSLNAQEPRFYSQTLIDLKIFPSTDRRMMYTVVKRGNRLYGRKCECYIRPHAWTPGWGPLCAPPKLSTVSRSEVGLKGKY